MEIAYQWQLSKDDNSWSDIELENDLSIVLIDGDDGNYIRAKISYTDKKGYPEDIYTESKQVNTIVNAIYGLVGGEEKYIELANWMAENVEENQIIDFNTLLILEIIKILKNLSLDLKIKRILLKT